jgi:hypothetical protein
MQPQPNPKSPISPTCSAGTRTTSPVRPAARCCLRRLPPRRTALPVATAVRSPRLPPRSLPVPVRPPLPPSVGWTTQALPGTASLLEASLPPEAPALKTAQEAEPKFDPIASAGEYAKCPHPVGAGLQPIVGKQVNEQNTPAPIPGERGL